MLPWHDLFLPMAFASMAFLIFFRVCPEWPVLRWSGGLYAHGDCVPKPCFVLLLVNRWTLVTLSIPLWLIGTRPVFCFRVVSLARTLAPKTAIDRQQMRGLAGGSARQMPFKGTERVIVIVNQTNSGIVSKATVGTLQRDGTSAYGLFRTNTYQPHWSELNSKHWRGPKSQEVV